ncbi:hypothetical protein Avbf_17413, partial [Armadillidium vulgare]
MMKKKKPSEEKPVKRCGAKKETPRRPFLFKRVVVILKPKIVSTRLKPSQLRPTFQKQVYQLRLCFHILKKNLGD